MNIANRPEVSGLLACLYSGVAVLIAAIAGIIVYLRFPTLQTGEILGLVVLATVEAIMISILTSIYRTKYILDDRELVLRASWFIGGSKNIPLKAIKSVERTLIPFGVRLFGASFYGGYYYLPSVGRTFMIITNFRDGVLIRAEHQNYVITPKNPENFIETIQKMQTQAQLAAEEGYCVQDESLERCPCHFFACGTMQMNLTSFLPLFLNWCFSLGGTKTTSPGLNFSSRSWLTTTPSPSRMKTSCSQL